MLRLVAGTASSRSVRAVVARRIAAPSPHAAPSLLSVCCSGRSSSAGFSGGSRRTQPSRSFASESAAGKEVPPSPLQQAKAKGSPKQQPKGKPARPPDNRIDTSGGFFKFMNPELYMDPRASSSRMIVVVVWVLMAAGYGYTSYTERQDQELQNRKEIEDMAWKARSARLVPMPVARGSSAPAGAPAGAADAAADAAADGGGGGGAAAATAAAAAPKLGGPMPAGPMPRRRDY